LGSNNEAFICSYFFVTFVTFRLFLYLLSHSIFTMKKDRILEIMKEKIELGWSLEKVYAYLCEIDEKQRGNFQEPL